MYKAGMNAACKAIFPHGIAAGSLPEAGRGCRRDFLAGVTLLPRFFAKALFESVVL